MVCDNSKPGDWEIHMFKGNTRSLNAASRVGADHRRGNVLVLTALMLIPLLVMVALAIDYGYVLKVQSDLQRAADAAALACVQDLVPAADGTQDLNKVRDTLRSYAASNAGQGFQVLDG